MFTYEFILWNADVTWHLFLSLKKAIEIDLHVISYSISHLTSYLKNECAYIHMKGIYHMWNVEKTHAYTWINHILIGVFRCDKHERCAYVGKFIKL